LKIKLKQKGTTMKYSDLEMNDQPMPPGQPMFLDIIPQQNGKPPKAPLPLKNKYINLGVEINQKSTFYVTKEILEANQYNKTCRKDKKKIQWINLLVNSPGGHVHGALAILDIMKSSEIPIRTIGSGIIASAATLIFIAGKERLLTPYSSFMIHQASHWISGKDHDIDSYIDWKSTLNATIVDHYVNHSKMTKKDFEKIMFGPTDKWLTPKEVKKYGMCDSIGNKLHFD
jgi:ATP-dependent protease ClpP protease subunit